MRRNPFASNICLSNSLTAANSRAAAAASRSLAVRRRTRMSGRLGPVEDDDGTGEEVVEDDALGGVESAIYLSYAMLGYIMLFIS
jgi:hypothetical protein